MEQAVIAQKRELVDFLIESGVLVDDAILALLDSCESTEGIIDRLKSKLTPDGFLDEKDVISILQSPQPTTTHQNKEENSVEQPQAQEQPSQTPQRKRRVKVVHTYDKKASKRQFQDFVSLFRTRFKAMERILLGRRELGSKVTSIQKIKTKKDKEEVGLIGMVNKIDITKNGNLIFSVEDMTGEIKILVNKSRTDLFTRAKEIVLDEVIGIVGMPAENIVFANNVIMPDLPLGKPFKKSPDEVYAVFLSDLHTGSHNFLYKEFTKFIKWINGELGNDAQKAMASKIKYLIIAGDLVDGVGIYPGQEDELDILDITKQYELVAQYLSKVPSHIEIICIPGNHDACRLAEPQLSFYEDFAESIYALPNVTVASNPSIVNIHASEDFEGFDVLLYHGFSFIYYGDKVDSIRASGGIDRPDMLMKFLLQKRHLSPTHGAAPYVPDPTEDHLIINKIPDFIVTGHIHKASVSNYRNVTMICGSCWQSITSFEEKLGLNPEPGRVPIVNLQTRECKLIKFIEE